MAFKFHKNKDKYFNWQYVNSKEAIIPFIETYCGLDENTRVLEIGCAEAGVLKAFVEKGCTCVGVELMENRLEYARHYMAEAMKQGRIEFVSKDIYEIDIDKEFEQKFDLIILKDVIEHIHDQPKIMVKLQEYLNPGGHIYMGFPPWQMPYGGHQQVARTKLLSKLPYYHLLPMWLYRFVLKLGEREDKVNNLCEIKETGISIEQFEKYAKHANYEVVKRTLFLIRPIYRFKFGLKPRKQWKFIERLPYLRNYITTGAYYLIKTKG